jgi:hypothetical protein
VSSFGSEPEFLSAFSLFGMGPPWFVRSMAEVSFEGGEL